MKKIILLFLLASTFEVYSAENIIHFNIFHTNDLHSHFDGVKVPVGKSFEKKGGFARLSTLIEKIKQNKKNEITIGVDAGDFFSGTIFSAMALSKNTDFPEYQFFVENSYDLLTLGNHEFDAEKDGLELMLDKAEKNSHQIPLVASNLRLDGPSSLEKFIGPEKLIRPYIVKEFTNSEGQLRVGFLGVLGPDACLVSRPTRADVHFIGFDDSKSNEELDKLAAHLNKMIINLRKKEKVDVVILSMHGGGEESFKLAKALKGLDILIAGHTHNQSFNIVNGVVISETGSYGENLGYLEFQFNAKTKKINLLGLDEKNKHLINVNEEIEENLSWKKRIDEWRKKSFKLMGHETEDPEEIIFSPRKNYIASAHIPNPLGSMLTKALREELNLLNPKEEDDVDIYLTSMGLVRSSFYQNIPYSRADIFEFVSIGYDNKKRPGVDVVSFYLTPKEIKLLVSFMELYSHISSSFSPAISPNLSFEIRKWGIPLINRIYNLQLNGKDFSEYDRLIKVATNKYILANIETVKKISYGLVDLQPKTKEGLPLKIYPIHPKEYQLLIRHFKNNLGRY